MSIRPRQVEKELSSAPSVTNSVKKDMAESLGPMRWARAEASPISFASIAPRKPTGAEANSDANEDITRKDNKRTYKDQGTQYVV